MALGIVYRQALPWSWGYFATMAAVGVVSIATQRRGWLAQGSIGPSLLLASTAVILQRFFYRELPDTWPRNAVVLSVLVSGLAAGFLVGLAVPESERVRRLSTTLTK